MMLFWWIALVMVQRGLPSHGIQFVAMPTSLSASFDDTVVFNCSAYGGSDILWYVNEVKVNDNYSIRREGGYIESKFSLSAKQSATVKCCIFVQDMLDQNEDPVVCSSPLAALTIHGPDCMNDTIGFEGEDITAASKLKKNFDYLLIVVLCFCSIITVTVLVLAVAVCYCMWSRWWGKSHGTSAGSEERRTYTTQNP